MDLIYLIVLFAGGGFTLIKFFILCDHVYKILCHLRSIDRSLNDDKTEEKAGG
jgi:hypothetical protein